MGRKKKVTDRIIVRVKLADLDEPAFKVRGEIDETGIAELAASINSVGLIEPMLVAKKKDRYEIIAGHRRFLALRRLSWETVEVMLFAGTSEQMTAVKLQENLHRQNLSIVEESRAIGYLSHNLKLGGIQIAELMGKSEGYVSQRLAVLQYPQGLMEALASNQISFAVARQLYHVEDPNTLKSLVDSAVTGGCSEKTASMWRQQYESVKQGENVAPEDSPNFQRTTPEQQTMFVCCGCRAMFAFMELTPLYFCTDCKGAMDMGKEGS